jgi:hypothetical protein
MAAEYPTQLVEDSGLELLPPGIDQSRLNANGLYVVRGLNHHLGRQLIARSRQSAVVKNCENDAKARFRNLASIAAWQTKGRLALPLVRHDSEGQLVLAGFGWMGPGKPNVEKGEPVIPGATTTFALRIYNGANGQGNATPFTQAILDTHEALYENDGVWLEAWGDNARALGSYSKVGFEHFATIPGMRHEEPVPRVYMTLGQLAVE